jgi:hypothetical protein
VANYKATFIFEQGPKGWTESYHTNNEPVALSQVMAWANVLAQARADLLGAESELKAIRVSSEDVLNDGMLRYVNMKATQLGDGAGAVPESDDADTAIQCRMENATGARHKLIFLRGIWDNINFTGGKLKKTDIIYNLRFQVFAGELKTRWGWYGVTDAVKRKQVIIGYASNAEGIVTLTTDGAFFEAGEIGLDKFVKVRISRLNKSQSELKGEVVVNPTTATTCKTVQSYGLLPFSSNGRISISTYQVWPCANVLMNKIVTRKAGSPLLESAGRAKKRARG